MTLPANERALDLLAAHATEGLEPRRLRELDELLESLPGDAAGGEMELSKEPFERAAAAIELAYTKIEPLPERLRQSIAWQAADVFGFRIDLPGDQEAAKVVRFPTLDGKRSSTGLSPWLGWMAAAAALVLAILSWLPEPVPQTIDRQIADTAINPARARSELLGREADAIQVDWTATEDPAAARASGDIVWSDALQEGYMLFRGLAVNDPAAWQYQLWIFDPLQDERYPVDGGVFDIRSDGEVVVPVDAKLEVSHATLFAITIEKPGGVVVSGRERLPLLAEVG